MIYYSLTGKTARQHGLCYRTGDACTTAGKNPDLFCEPALSGATETNFQPVDSGALVVVLLAKVLLTAVQQLGCHSLDKWCKTIQIHVFERLGSFG